MTASRQALLLCLLGLLPSAARAAVPDGPWPQLLGPERNGRSAETGLNLDWQARAPKVVWKVPLGPAFSSLAVLDDRLLTTTKKGMRDHVVCLSLADGKELWSHDAAASYVDVQGQGSGPRATPTVVNGKAYCLLPRGDLLCLDVRDGKELWKVNILEAAKAKDRAGETYYWGLSASPLVEGEAVIVQPGGEKDGSVLAFHCDTGRPLWGVGGDPSGYASPIVITAAGRRQVVVPTGRSILGIEPKTGGLLWRYVFGNRFDATCANPVWTGKVLFVSAAYQTGCAALEILPDGDGLKVREKWANRNLMTLMATTIYHDGHLYGCNGDLGAMTLRCLDVENGEIKWQQRWPDRFGMVSAEGHLFCLGERGTLRLVQMDPARYVPKGELADVLMFKSWAMPALAKKRLYIRDQRHVACLDLARE
jgi:outer membrane protein assembly factor BamB